MNYYGFTLVSRKLKLDCISVNQPTCHGPYLVHSCLHINNCQLSGASGLLLLYQLPSRLARGQLHYQLQNLFVGKVCCNMGCGFPLFCAPVLNSNDILLYPKQSVIFKNTHKSSAKLCFPGHSKMSDKEMTNG